ncbi:zinc finger protein 367-like [Stegodyphus dumicola]|uniref:zinc finger protein 367-like n=1 Tax=Stegodyphus dumicola TaxID=202533 RepID=UPI0015ACFA14|nr:zinc finger protein 367-like [Stegodyphus dumicola]
MFLDWSVIMIPDIDESYLKTDELSSESDNVISSRNNQNNFSTCSESEPELSNNPRFNNDESRLVAEEQSSEADKDIFSENSQQSSFSSRSASGSELEYSGNRKCKNSNYSVRRGRPRSEIITSLMEEGAASQSNIKCSICQRVFPRTKSLSAHMRTHTGEKPYACDYPECNKIFTQSGQLKSHLRTHANDMPFVCTYPGCGTRYKHSSRFCRGHPRSPLIRDGKGLEGPNAAELTKEQMQWLNKYKENRRQALQNLKRQRIETNENDSRMPKKVKQNAKHEDDLEVQKRLSLISTREREAVQGLLHLLDPHLHIPCLS